ncbi:MAG: hypothetical protein LBD18_02235 [Treponema sp.]|jgi:diacylglycerol kinase family enzyme|nr:hypothetical protein [Treponema sp.]
MRHLFILNPKSFQNKRKMDFVISGIRECFKAAGSGDYVVHVSRFPREAIGLVYSCAGTLPEKATLRVYAVGGDGILFDCLNGAMAFTSPANRRRREDAPGVTVELAAIPYGRDNKFLRGFGKKSIASFRDISLQCKARTIPLDVMYDGANYALNSCVTGTEALAALNTYKLRDRMENGGSLLRLLETIFYKHLFYVGELQARLGKKNIRQHYRVTLDGTDFSGQYRSFTIANTPWYKGNKCPVRTAMPGDGLLEILFANGNASADFCIRQARKITIHSGEPVSYSLDGVVFFDTSLKIELLPAAIQFVDVTGRGYLGGLIDG